MKIDTEMLCSFIDGELDAATAAAVRAALDTDENLRQECEDLRKTAELVRGLPKVSAPPELVEAITANAEREQLLGKTAVGPTTGRPWLYWGLSVAASLLIGAAVGILGYHSLQGEPEPSAGPFLVMSEKKEPGGLSETFGFNEADSPAPLNVPLVLDGRSTSDAVGEDVTMLTKSDRGITIAKGKGGERIARSGPKTGIPAESVGRAGGVPGMGSSDEEQLADARQTVAVAAKEEVPQESEYAAGDKTPLAYDMKPRAKDAAADAVMGDVEAHTRPEAGQRLSLEPQVRANNFVNQEMAAKLSFETEPLNVKVVSNDTTKTLQYVQQWAARNFLVDLNKASSKVSFPVYTQVVYQGQPGSNIELANQNGILLRTTRSQAQQIVSELRRQEPVVVSVSVKDEKNSLGLDSQQLQRAEGSVVARRRFGAREEQSLLVPQPTDGAAQAQRALKEIDKDSADGVAASAPERLMDQQAKPASALSTKAGTEYYLSQITNQMQALSLDDLVTLVVMVADARCPAELNRSSPVATPARDPEATESK